jgi:uncharacterized membrane protein YvbJ
MIKEKHRIDTIAWLIITVVCVSLITIFFISENIGLKEKNHLLITIEKNDQHIIDSLKNSNDSLRNEMEIIVDYCEESYKLYEDEISFLGHTLDKHGIHPDYTKFGK